MKTVNVSREVKNAYFSTKLSLIATFISGVLVAYQLSNFYLITNLISALRSVSM